MQKTRALIVAAALVTAGSVGAIAGSLLTTPPPSQPPAAPAEEPDPQLPRNRIHRNITVDDQGWIDIAIRANRRTEVTITDELCIAEDSWSDAPRWFAEIDVQKPGWAGGLTMSSSDGDRGASAQAGDVRQDVWVPDPSHPARWCSEGYETMTGSNVNFSRYAHVWHETYVWSGFDFDPDRSTIHLDIRNATVAVRQGPGGGEPWAYTLDDFTADTAAVHADLPGLGPRAATASTLRADLTGNRSAAVWSWWMGHDRSMQADGEVTITRPNGSTIRPHPLVGVLGLTRQTGGWEFRVPQRVGLNDNLPVLIGASITPADPPKPG